MFVLNPDPYLLPDYKISPFSTKDIPGNLELPADNSIDEYLTKRFPGRVFQYTYNGRSALNIALNYYQLTKNDLVTVLTTSGNKYISNCVTSEINKFCSWNREVKPETKVILVIHEFGYPYPDLEGLKNYGIPVIEDSAYAFFSQDQQYLINSIGDFVIFSFPKMFPLQIGGLLVYSNDKSISGTGLKQDELAYIKKVLSFNILKKDEIIKKRLGNYQILTESFSEYGLEERFNIEPGVVPGVFMFKDHHVVLNLESLKTTFFAHGVQCSVFYGENAFFIPVHQSLTEEDFKYFIAIFRSFLSNKKKL